MDSEIKFWHSFLMMDINSGGHIVRLTMLAECGISTQKLSEIQGKGHRRSPENVSVFSKIYPGFLKIYHFQIFMKSFMIKV